MLRNHPLAASIVIMCASLAAVGLRAPTAYSATDDGTIAAKSDAQLENPATKSTTPAVPENGTAVTDDTASPREEKEALKRRAGEQNGEDPNGRALVLGMSLQEGER